MATTTTTKKKRTQTLNIDILGHSGTKLGGCNCTRFFPNKLSNLSVIIAKLRHYFMMCVPLGSGNFFKRMSQTTITCRWTTDICMTSFYLLWRLNPGSSSRFCVLSKFRRIFFFFVVVFRFVCLLLLLLFLWAFYVQPFTCYCSLHQRQPFEEIFRESETLANTVFPFFSWQVPSLRITLRSDVM